MSEKKALGRPPLKNAKSVKLTVRVEQEECAILDDYCKRANVSRADGVRKALRCLKNEK